MIPSNWQSLQVRIALLTLAIFLLAIWSIALYGNAAIHREMQHQLGALQFSTTTFVADEIGEELESRFKALKVVAEAITASARFDKDSVQHFLDDRLLLQDLFNGGVFVTDANAIAIAELPRSAGRVGTNYQDRDSITVPLKDRTPVIGRPAMGKKLRAPIFSMVVPIRGPNEKVVGTLAGTINLGKRNFLDKVTDGHFGTSGTFLLIAPEHRLVVTSSDKARVMQPLPPKGESELFDRYLESGDGFGVAKNTQDELELSAGKEIPIANWVLVATLPANEAFAPIDVVQREMLIITAVLTIIAGGLTWLAVTWMLRRQFSPMVEVARRLEEVSRSEEPLPFLPMVRHDEIGKLIGSFNRLLCIVAQREQALRESEQRYRTLVDWTPDAVALHRNGKVLYVNPSAVKLMHANSAADLVGKPVSHFIHPDFQQIVQERIRKQAEAGTTLPLEEEKFIALDGTLIDVEVQSTPIVYDGMSVVHVAIRDITQRKLAEKARAESEARYRTAFLTSPDAVNISRVEDGRFLEVNDSFSRIMGWAKDEVIGHTATELGIWRNPADRVRMIEILGQDSYCQNLEADFVTRNGKILTMLISAHVVTLNDEQCILSIIRDITERKLAEEQIRKLSLAVEQSPESIVITDLCGEIEYVNPAFAHNTGYTLDEVRGKNPRILQSGKTPQETFREMWQTLLAGKSWSGPLCNRRKDGSEYMEFAIITPIRQADGQVTHYVAVKEDVTAKKAAEDRINHLAYYDILTDLPNRQLLQDRLKQALASCARSGRQCALLLIDLDNFKGLNDTLGHDIGDLLLQQVAQRLSACTRAGDTVCRLGGDEFVVLLEDLSPNALEAANQAEVVTTKIVGALSQSFSLTSYDYHASASIGIALLADSESTIEDMLKRADLAMYQAKAAGRNTFRFFDSNMQTAVMQRMALEAGMRDALMRDEFRLYFQPQVAHDGTVIGAEALLRWQSAERGMVSPGEFIPLAEDTGLIMPIGQWVLEAACKQLAIWSGDPAFAGLTIAVNVSARQFGQKDFVDQVLAVIEHTGANPAQLKLELTEGGFVVDVEGVVAKMSALKNRGISFALDDFGTGYSCLSYLKRLPLDQLKIDQSFVRDVMEDPNDAAIARTVIALGYALELRVIAEGVETEAQRDYLWKQGCRAYQGFLFSKPLPLQEFESYIRRRRSSEVWRPADCAA